MFLICSNRENSSGITFKNIVAIKKVFDKKYLCQKNTARSIYDGTEPKGVKDIEIADKNNTKI